ncbi:MAG: Activator of Hsp90 ATPase 1 family protein [Verrucomicrobia bacterium]|nr:Activator of Hsp90 ATPase 1 family protein [Verrucomicrobiota bacterium]
MTLKSKLTESGEQEVVATRFFAQPREAVFRAIVDPISLARWWGPKGFTNTFQEFDFLPGGRWRYVMRGPDGVEYPNLSEFVAIDPPGRLVLDHLEPFHWFRLTMLLAPEGTGTRLTWSQRFASVEECAKVRSFVIEANEQNLDRLAAVLGETFYSKTS